MAEKKKSTSKKSDKKVMDVAKPGKTAPSASSRPVIVGHKPTLQDPMVNEDKEMPSGESEEHKIDVKRTGPKVIAPLTPPEELTADKSSVTDIQHKPDDPPEESKVDTPETPTEELPEEKAEETPVEGAESAPIPDNASEDGVASDEEPAEELPDDESTETEGVEEGQEATPETRPDEKEPKDKKDSKSSSIVDAIASQAAKNKDKKDDKKNEEMQKRLAEIEKLVEDKKYFVHTSNTTKKERKTRWLVLLLSILLLAAGYLAIDAQLVKNDYWLPYHFFKEEKKNTASDLPVANTDQNDASSNDEPEVKEAYTGEIVESAKKAFSLKIPDGWKIILVEDGDMLFSEHRGGDGNVFSDALEYKSGTKPVVEKLSMLGTDAPIRFSISYQDLDATYEGIDDTYTKSDLTTEAGVKGTRFYKQFPLDMESELGPSPAEKRYVYEFKSSTKKFYITYRIMEKTEGKEDGLAESDNNRLELIEQVVKTFVIK